MLNFESENVTFTKLLKKKLMIRHTKIYKIIEFFTIFIISLYFEELYPGTTQLKSTSRFDIHKAQHM